MTGFSVAFLSDTFNNINTNMGNNTEYDTLEYYL